LQGQLKDSGGAEAAEEFTTESAEETETTHLVLR
jgi:hypothetical protein